MPISAPVSPNPIGPTGSYAEQADSGAWIVNRVYRVTLKYRVQPYSFSVANAFYRGDLITIGAANYIVSESRIARQKGQIALIEVDCDSEDVLPPDEFSLDPVEQNPRIERSPLFYALTSSDIALVQQAFLALSAGQVQNAINAFPNTSNPDLAQKLYDKLRQGKETYYLSQWRYSWRSYWTSAAPPLPYLGGTIQIPGGPLSGLIGAAEWLREADGLTSAGQSPLGTTVVLTRTWIGGPLTFWDTDLY